MKKLIKFKVTGEFVTEVPDNVKEGQINDMIAMHPEKLAGYIEHVEVEFAPEADNIIPVAVGASGKLMRV